MYFSPATVAAVATLLTAAQAAPLNTEAHQRDDVTLVQRGLFDFWYGGQSQSALCYKPNYGAVGKPWEHNSTPGAFCGNKPKNSGQWKNIVTWDGGDKNKCNNWFSAWGLNICGNGNKRAPLPKGCRPPKARGPKTPVPVSSVVPKPVSSAVAPAASSAAAVVSSAAAGAASSAAGAASSAAGAASSAAGAASSAAASVASSAGGAVASPVSSAAAVASSAAADTPVSSAAAAASSDAAAASSAAAVSPSSVPGNTAPVNDDPYADPVCSSNYQQTYKDYTLVAPNGYWTGKVVGAATQDASYMTYTLASDPSECLKACDNIEGCVFVNSYIDRNDDEAYLPKHTPGVYTCAFFSTCVGTEKNDNWGGQDDPNDILNSTGWCKSGACGGAK